ncbi:MAG: AAA family ATPase, partial [Oscillospiraceae bacterium]
MRLKSLDIQGFKSFPDRTKLDFDLGVTAVVGPNGSGKSNIADAVRWVLGEQSTRTLRGGKMEDVIFGGTQTRKAQGVASVTLTVDNTDRCLGLDADEVAVTRRLYRTGDSEYRINGAMVRLRDINELLMDTGLGRDGYSIIGQGRVAEIVSARSKERREIFEEAAGITKFRYRKTEAERQLAMAEENLVRLRDILEELASRVGPLKEQSSKAQKFLDFSAEKKILEVSIWMHTLREAGQRAAALEDQFLLTQRDYDEASDAVTAQETAFSDEQERGHVLMAEIETLRTEAERLSDQLRDWGSQTAVLQNDIGHHRRAIEEAKGAIAQAGRSREETEAEIKAKIQNKALQQKDIVEARTAQEALTRQVSVLDAEGVGRAEALDALRMRRTGVFEAIEAARMDAASASTLLTDSISRLETMQRAVNECAQVVSQLETEGVSCSELRTQLDESLIEMDNAAKGYLLKRDSRRQKLDALTAEDDVLAKRIHEKRQRATLLTELEKNMEGFAPSIKYVMKQSKVGALPGVRGPVSSLLHVKSEHTLAIETALGGALQNIVVENEETAKRAIRQLDAARTGRATFLPMTSVSGRAMDARDLVGRRGFVGVASELVEADDANVG